MNTAARSVNADAIQTPATAADSAISPDSPAQLNILARRRNRETDDDVCLIGNGSTPGKPIGERVLVSRVDLCVIPVACDEAPAAGDDVSEGIRADLDFHDAAIIAIGWDAGVIFKSVTVAE